jgi:transposase
VDAAHFVQGSFLGCLWSPKRIFIPSSSGRRRYNVLGALNGITKEVITVENEGYINSESVGELLIKIAHRRVNDKTTLILDNAKYQTCDAVKNIAKELGIDLLFLPPYSPNLNLIERLWKFVKKHALNSKYYSTFGEFKKAICDVVHTNDLELIKEREDLLSLNFQDFNKAKVSPA